MLEIIRCFVAIEIPDNIKKEIDQYIYNLKKISSEVKWIKASSMHITLKFLGEIESGLYNRVGDSLKSVNEVSNPFKIQIKDFGAFPNSKKPRVVWLGLNPNPGDSLTKLFNWIDGKTAELGFERENRKFSPHLTLGRIKYPGNYSSIFEYMENNSLKDLEFTATQIVLMRSQLRPAGAHYTVINNYPF